MAFWILNLETSSGQEVSKWCEEYPGAKQPTLIGRVKGGSGTAIIETFNDKQAVEMKLRFGEHVVNGPL